MAAARKPLRAVQPGERRGPKSVADAAASGSHRDLLVAMRDRIAVTVANPACPPRDLASLTKRLADLAKEIDALDARAEQEAKESAVTADEAWDAEAL